MVIVRAPAIVASVWVTRYRSGESSWITVSVPSPFEANTVLVAGSNPAASTPAPIGSMATTRPRAASDTAMRRLPQTLNRRSCARSIASPLGSSQGAIDQRRVTFRERTSIAATCALSAMLT
jgi:hypothetical protein